MDQTTTDRNALPDGQELDTFEPSFVITAAGSRQARPERAIRRRSMCPKSGEVASRDRGEPTSQHGNRQWRAYAAFSELN
jgi:hypothetical protein